MNSMAWAAGAVGIFHAGGGIFTFPLLRPRNAGTYPVVRKLISPNSGTRVRFGEKNVVRIIHEDHIPDTKNLSPFAPLTQRRWSGVNDSHSNTRQRVDPTPEPPPGRIGPLCRMAWWPTVTGRRVIVRRDYGRSVTFDPSVSQEPERLGPPETHPLMGPTS